MQYETKLQQSYNYLTARRLILYSCILRALTINEGETVA
ncbi:hypothetical protein ES705_13852 [subsurface metagenome]